MGEVFRATDEQLGREVAVKLMLPSDRDPQAAERFQREARSAAMLNDPHLVAVYDFGQHEDQFFLVMELVEGRTVSDELTERGALPKDRATNIVEQAAAGLAAAHRQDVVHRDVKPSNLLLTPDGTVKVADFGIAHLAGDGSTTLTAPGQIIGSTNYLAPERAQGRRAGKASDVYSLGCVLYQLVTGQPPFTAEHPTAILYQHVDTPPTPPSATRPELSGSFETVLLRMLAKDPDDRPTAAEIAAGALRLAPSDGAAGVPAVVPTAETEVVEPATPITPLEPPDQNRRKTLLIAGIAVVATAAAVVGGILLNGNRTKLPTENDVGPRPGVTSTTGSTPAPSTTGPTDSGAANQPSRTTSTQPTPSASRPSSPTPSSSNPSSSAPSSTPPTEDPTSAPTQSTPTSNPPSSSTTPDDPTSSTPPADTPPPDPGNEVDQ